MNAAVTLAASGPWSARDRRAVTGWLVTGAVLVVAAWFFAAGEVETADQLVFVNVGVVGGLVWLGGLFSWVARGRRQVGRRARQLVGAAPSADLAVVSAETLVAGADRHWFHRADCLLARSRGWSSAPRSQHERTGRQPCPACNPKGTPPKPEVSAGTPPAAARQFSNPRS
jgi:hypothetical protein